ncbi:MAG: DegT/DnrJ/EryC1/StrS family aminotransferase [Thermoplasmatota archaeon]
MTNVPFLDVAAGYREQKADIDQAFQRVMAAGRFILGPELEAFEREFATAHDTRHAIGVGNGLDALVLALRALGVGPGDRVLVPGHTFIATWLAVSYAGAEPVPVDVDLATYNMDVAATRRAIGPGVRAILPVHLYGQPADMTGLRGLADEHDLALVEDAAQAHGARVQGRPVGGLGDVSCFSFYPGKNLGAFGDGGAVLTNDDDLADRVRTLRNYGSRRKYDHEALGVNSRLDEMQAAFLRVRLRKLTDWNANRAHIAKTYLDALADAPGLVLPSVPAGLDPVWHLFVVRHAQRDQLQRLLLEAGIETLVHYPVPPHHAGAYAGRRWPDLPSSELAARTVLSLPIGPHMDTSQVQWVVQAVGAACRRLDGS